MSDIALEFNHVWKKFKRGEKYDSLRDLIPALAKGLLSGNHRGELGEREFWAVNDVSFHVERGEALGIIGPNGAGKSTILKLLSGILRPNKGEITVKGRLSALIEVGAGFHQDLTGRENIYLNGAILGMTKREIDKKFDEIVEFSGVEEFIDTPVKRYSSGMYARLGFSVAAHVDPDILLVDEVLSVGDLEFQQKCINKMLSLKNNGVPIVFVSHNLQSIQMLCNKAILVKIGRIAKEGSAGEIIADYTYNTNVTTDHDSETFIKDVLVYSFIGKAQGNVFQAGERGILEFKVKVERQPDEYLLGLLIRRTTDGVLACDYNFPLSQLGLRKEDVGLEKNVMLKFEANLLRGFYSISLHLYHIQSMRHIFWANNIAHLAIEERISCEGISFLNPELHRQ
jgi:lipopolysaccharide transport system ATP-binding protein